MRRFEGTLWVYVAGPYTNPSPTVNTHNTIQIAEELLKEGFFPVVPTSPCCGTW